MSIRRIRLFRHNVKVQPHYLFFKKPKFVSAIQQGVISCNLKGVSESKSKNC